MQSEKKTKKELKKGIKTKNIANSQKKVKQTKENLKMYESKYFAENNKRAQKQ